MTVRTDFEWSYEPADFFEAPLHISAAHGHFVLETGRATYTLSVATDPVPKTLLEAVEQEVSNCLALRQLLTRRPFTLRGPGIVQHQTGGGRNAVAMVKVGAHTVSSIGHADVVTRDEAGQVVRDTRAERIAAEAAFISSLAPKVPKSELLKGMLHSYGEAIKDSADELIHLYEICEAAASHFGGETAARKALDIPKADWKVLGKLANDAHIREGRHRGKRMGNLRPATAEELDAARTVARRIIKAFAAAT